MKLWSVTRRAVYFETVYVEAEHEAEAIERAEDEEIARSLADPDDVEILGVVPLPVVPAE